MPIRPMPPPLSLENGRDVVILEPAKRSELFDEGPVVGGVGYHQARGARHSSVSSAGPGGMWELLRSLDHDVHGHSCNSAGA